MFCLQSHGKFREMISAQQLISCDMGGTCAGGYDGFTARHFENADGTPKAVPGECYFYFGTGDSTDVVFFKQPRATFPTPTAPAFGPREAENSALSVTPQITTRGHTPLTLVLTSPPTTGTPSPSVSATKAASRFVSFYFRMYG